MLYAAKGAPALQATSPSSGDAALTPNTARIRYLEQHPELVFGGGSKVDNSPAGQDRAQEVRCPALPPLLLRGWALAPELGCDAGSDAGSTEGRWC